MRVPIAADFAAQVVPSRIDTTGCRGNTIKVVAGHYMDLATPQSDQIEIESIAGALSKICRFGGHCPQFYSVAEHCIHAVNQACLDGFTGDILKAILLHDATEAYLGDIVRPLKKLLPDYAVFEERMEKAIEQRFGVDFTKHADVIKKYDRLMLKSEKIFMWPWDREEWEGFGEVETREVLLQLWSPEAADEMFLGMARALRVE